MGAKFDKHRLSVGRMAMLAMLAGFLLLAFRETFARGKLSAQQQTLSLKAAAACMTQTKPIPLMRTRDEIGALLNREPKMFVGLELGVQRGYFAQTTLKQWKKCKKYILVDLWGQQKNYDDIANVDDRQQEQIYRECQANLKPYEDRGVDLEYLRMLTSEAVDRIGNGTMDFIYVDARHDYCGVKEDMELYWPKLRDGGIMAGHDYVEESTWREGGQDWSLCLDGSRHPLAVLGAVNEFAETNNLQVIVTPFDKWHSWMIRKPETLCT